jgi:hypothetical protein
VRKHSKNQHSPQLVEAYTLIARFQAYRHHIYIQAHKDPREEWVQSKYKITEEDIQLIMQDWEPDWKVPANETKTEHPDNEEEDQDNGQGNEQGNGAGDAQETVLEVGEKMNDKGKGFRKIGVLVSP